MGTLFSTISIGRAGLFAAQIQLDTTAHNISNVNTDGFSRQRVDMTTFAPNVREFGVIGRGPKIGGIERIRDEFLDTVYREQVAGLGLSEITARFFNQIEDIFQEPGGEGLTSRIDIFFDALNDFASSVEDLPTRVALLAEAETVASTFRQVSGRLATLRTVANEEVRDLVPEINSLAAQIAESNRAIGRAENTGNKANDLRDKRDLLLDKLSRIANVTIGQGDGSSVNVLLGGDELVVGVRTRTLITQTDATIDPDRPDLLSVYFQDNLLQATILDGDLAGAIQMRDIELRNLEDEFDQLAAAMIEEVNAIHAQGNGLQPYAAPMSASYTVSDPAAALDSAGLPFAVQDGSFDLVAYDASGAIVETVTVPVTAAATTLNDIAAAISGSASFSAAVNASNVLTITPAAGIRYTFANDTSNFPASLGLNNFFTGSDAANIGVNQDLLDTPALVSGAFSLDILDTGDNTAALALAALRNAPVMSGGTESFNEFLESTIVKAGVSSKANQDSLEVVSSFVDDFDRRRKEISGVSLDEEVSSLVLFQRAFEASARTITVADQMLQTVLNMAR